MWTRLLTETDWQKVDGVSLVQISVGLDERVMGVASDNQIYTSKGFKNKWHKIDGALKQVYLWSSSCIKSFNLHINQDWFFRCFKYVSNAIFGLLIVWFAQISSYPIIHPFPSFFF